MTLLFAFGHCEAVFKSCSDHQLKLSLGSPEFNSSATQSMSLHLNVCSISGLESGELHLCSDPSPSSRERGRFGSYQRQDILWCSGQYSEGK